MIARAIEGRPLFRGADDVAAIEAEGLERFVPESSPIEQLVLAGERWPDRIAVRLLSGSEPGAPSREWSCAELVRQIRRAANLFRSLGIGPGDSIATLMPAVPETHAAVWGAAAAGIVVPINHYLEPELIGRMLERVGARALVIHGPEHDFVGWEKLAAIRACAPALAHVLQVGGGRTEGTLPFEALLRSRNGDRFEGERRIRPDDLAAYFHTGGTTGLPKFAPQTHRNQAIAARVSAYGMGCGPGDRVLCGMPLFHAGGLMGCGLVPLVSGATVVLATPDGFRGPEVIARLWSLLDAERISILVGPPTVYGALCTIPVDGHSLRSVRHGVSSAAGLPAETLRRFERHCGIRIREAYGLTEATLLVCANPPDGDATPGSVGLRLPFVEVGVADPDGTVATHGSGAIVIRGPANFPGYLDAAAGAPRAVDGWLTSGDLGRIDAEGRVFLTGRERDLIIRGGHNIDPRLIEEPLLEHPHVAACAAVGKPDAHAGELPIAYVVPANGVQLDADELRAYAMRRILERAAVPKEFVVVESLPATAVGKPDKLRLRLRALADACRERLERHGMSDVRVRTLVDPSHGPTALVALPGGAPASAPADVRELLGVLGCAIRVEAGVSRSDADGNDH